ncbi:MAG: holo-ACP synthase [Mycobacterium leprae]
MITGIGVDIIEVERIARVLARHPGRFLDRVYTPGEQADCAAADASVAAQRLAARFAAKEALLKALGIGLRSVRWTDVEVVRAQSGKPSLRLSGALAEVARAQQVTALHVSMSHCKEYAMAQVVAVQ